MTTSTIVARVEELIRRAEALDQGGASERSRALATRLRSTVLRPLADLGDTLERESQTADVQELVFELAIDLTRACATDQRAALLEACAGAHYLVTIGRDDAQERIARFAEIARDVPGDPKGGIRVRMSGQRLGVGARTHHRAAIQNTCSGRRQTSGAARRPAIISPSRAAWTFAGNIATSSAIRP